MSNVIFVTLLVAIKIQFQDNWSRNITEPSILQEEGCEPLVHLKEDRGKMLQELENCSDSKIREMVPHI